MASRYRNTPLSKCYTINENEKKKQYNEKMLQVTVASLPLLSLEMKSLGESVDGFIQSWQNELQRKKKQPYSIIGSWIIRKIILSLLRSIGLCLRGLGSIRENENIVKSIQNDAVVSEGLTKISF